MASATAEAIVENLLLDHLSAFKSDTQGDTPIEDGNRAFRKPAKGMYLRALHQPNQTEQAALGDHGDNRLFGILQVDVMAPTNSGTLSSREVAGEIIRHFHRNLTLSLHGVSVRMERPAYASAPIVRTDGWMQTPVTIRYRADAPNP